ncbi:MAG TPA: hypothetical protein VFS30_01440 [Dehalococcoidia bacterium]|nr:hypothetical protein [Dehalococcoidia bacterium]
MHRSRLFLVLAGLIISLTIVTAALAATLVFDGDDDTPDRASPNTGALSTPSPTVEAEQPDGIPDEVWANLEALPDKLRDDLLARFEAGGLGVPEIETVIEEYEGRNQGVRVGTVLDATDSVLRLEVYTTGERAEVALNDETVLRRGHDDITAADLEPDELVMVISRDGGVTAFSVTAFGVGAP